MDEAETHLYGLQTQDQQLKVTGNLSVKQIQKLNKELAKQRKSLDALRKEREVLVSDKVKLKSENKHLERVLKKTASKGDFQRMSKKQSQPPMEESILDMEEMKIKVMELEDYLAERDRKITVLSLKLERHSDCPDGIDEGDRIRTNGGILESTSTLEKLLEEQENSLRLRKENADLRSCISVMDTELEKLHKERDSNLSPKSQRKRSSGFFKRGKKSTSSMPSRYMGGGGPHDIIRGQKRSESPVMGKSESHQELDTSLSPLLIRAHKESTISLPSYGSPNQSPHISPRNKINADVVTLQSCLKLALNEKSLCEENIVYLQKELEVAQGRIKELESDLAAKTNKEMEKIRKSLTAAEIDRDTYLDELKISQQEVDEMMEKQNMLEKSFTDASNDKIKELEEEVEALRSNRYSSFSGSSSNISSPKTSTSASICSPNVVSPTRKVKDPVQPPSKSGTTESSTSSSDNSTHGKVKQLSRDLSVEKQPVPTSSSTRKVGKLSRQSSIDQFEVPIDNTNAKHVNSVSSVPPPSPSPVYTKVAATRALFEQKIDQTKINQSPIRHSSKLTENDEQRRQRFSMSGNVTSNMESRARSVTVHSKSRSYDHSTKSPAVFKKGTVIQKVPEVAKVHVHVDKSKSVPPPSKRDTSNAGNAVDNETRNKINNSHKQQQEKTRTSSSVYVQGTNYSSHKTSENTSSSAGTTTSKITVTSTATSTDAAKSTQPPVPPSTVLGKNSSNPSLISAPSPSSSQTRVFSQQRTPGKVTAISVRKSNPLKSSSLDEHSTTPNRNVHYTNRNVQSTVTKSQTQVKIHPPVFRSWSKSDKQPPQTENNNYTTTVSSTPVSNVSATSSPAIRPAPKTTLQYNKLHYPLTKAGSLQNTQSFANSADDISIQTATQNNVKAPSSVASSAAKKGPTHRALQNRERKDRPKTMYAGNPEATNLVNLISKFQDEDREKKLRDMQRTTGSSMSSLVIRPSMNGTFKSSSSLVSNPVSSVPPALSSSTSNINHIPPSGPSGPGNNRQRFIAFHNTDTSDAR